MSNSKQDLALPSVLSAIPLGLRAPLLSAFCEITKNFKESRWEPAELNGGKLCEVVHTILRGYVDGAYADKPAKPKNMVDACRALEGSPATLNRSVRIQIPRVLLALYEIRNNRGVGHVGGDVEANHMDAVAVVAMSKWIICELVRIFHNTDTETATALVDALSERDIPLIWEVDGKRRVLNPKLSMKHKSLIILYGSSSPIVESTLFEWVEHSNAGVFRRDVLKKAHKDKLIEYDQRSSRVQLSPLGARYVEEQIALDF